MGLGQFIQPILDKRDAKDYVYLQKVNADTYAIFIRPTITSRWIRFYIYHTVNSSIRLDFWRLYQVFACDLTGPDPQRGSVINVNELTVTGSAWEQSINPQGDTWAGSIHGYEETQTLAIFIDGKPVSLSVGDIVKGRVCNFVQLANILKPADVSLLAESLIDFKFTPDGLEIDNQITWKQTLNISTMYWPMVPWKRDAAVTTKGRYFNDAVVQDISVADFPERHIDSHGITVWNDTNKLFMSMEVLNPAESLNNYQTNGTLKTWISNSASYNKGYFTLYGTTTGVTSGNVITSKSKFTAIWET